VMLRLSDKEVFVRREAVVRPLHPETPNPKD